MSRIIVPVGLAALAALLTGCVPGNIQGMVAEMAKSPRSWCLAATGYGVNLKIGGSGTGEHGGEGDMSCTDGGLSLKSQGANQVGLPVTIVPQLSVGPPSLVPAPPPVQRPRVIPQQGPEPAGVILTPIMWQSESVAPSAPLTADLRLLLFSIGDLHGLTPLQ